MIDDYMRRARHLARQTGFTKIDEIQIDLRNCKTRADETQQLLPPAPNMRYVILDERGKALTSRQMAAQLSSWRDDGDQAVSFVIGGADGFEPAALPTGVTRWAFGPQTWPHKFVRVMLAEQVYRMLSILAGTPYHRD